jgi:long-chain fatty acid transport protein
LPALSQVFFLSTLLIESNSLKKFAPLIVLSLFLTYPTYATDGYFPHGYGVKSQGMGGIGVAFPQDSIAAAMNPAGMGLIGDRLDVGITLFKPDRNSKIVGNGGGADGTYGGNDTKDFLIPEFGINKQIDDQYSIGLSVYANGGMNTDYYGGIPLFTTTGASSGVDLKQIFFVPTITWKPLPKHTLGLSVNLAYQSFEAKGLQNFTGASTTSSPNNVTNNDHDNSYGAGIKLGWIGELNEYLTIGATYHSKTYMTEFDKYKGLFAEKGDFDIPAHYAIGIALKPLPDFVLAMDYQRIEYSDVRSVNNPLLPNLSSSKLGNSDGAGFGWDDVNIIKVGVSYDWSPNLTIRAGYNHSSQPIPNSETFFNILAPGVVQDHATFGITYDVSEKSEISFAYMHAFKNSVNGSGSIPSAYGGGETNLEMKQNSLGLAYAYKF